MTQAHAQIAPPDTDVGLRVLAVGEDSAFKDVARYGAAQHAHLVLARDQSSALRPLSQQVWDMCMVLLDTDAEDQLSWWVEILGRTSPRPRLVAVVPNASIGFALRAAALGVFEVLPLPIRRERFLELVERVRSAADEKILPLAEVRPITVGPFKMASESPAMLPVFQAVARVSPSAVSVLIEGESGTGKELVAQAIHQRGPRAAEPFVAINCAAIPENLLESELFGHEKGAFTGAVARKIGRFERATGGTLFLDEIGDMSLVLQSKILRAVQEREIERVGGAEPIPVDVRLIAATHRDLKAMIAQGRFREDLYYRLAVVTIPLPRLADRGDDLCLLVALFLREFGQRYGKTFNGVTDQALSLLRQHEWVGNVRELRNVIERAALIAEGATLRAEHLPEEWRTSQSANRSTEVSALATLREVEAQHIGRVLAHTGGQIGEAASILGVHRNTLARKIREYGL